MNTNLNTLSTATAATVALALSDGTAVDFVKITSKDRIQVRVPSDHAELGSDPLRIFRRDGSHYKDATDLKLVIKEAAADGAATTSAPAAAPAATPTTAAAPTPTSYEVDGQTFDNLADAKAEALDIFRDGDDDTVEIFAITRTVVGRVGFVAA